MAAPDPPNLAEIASAVAGVLTFAVTTTAIVVAGLRSLARDRAARDAQVVIRVDRPSAEGWSHATVYVTVPDFTLPRRVRLTTHCRLLSDGKGGRNDGGVIVHYPGDLDDGADDVIIVPAYPHDRNILYAQFRARLPTNAQTPIKVELLTPDDKVAFRHARFTAPDH